MDVSFYVVLEPRRQRWQRQSEAPGSASAVGVRKHRGFLRSEQVEVKITLSVDPAIFMSPAYEVSGVVDADLSKAVELAVADLAAARFASESVEEP